MELTEKQKLCDHHFGDEGNLKECTKCHLDRDLARLAGKSAHRRSNPQPN